MTRPRCCGWCSPPRRCGRAARWRRCWRTAGASPRRWPTGCARGSTRPSRALLATGIARARARSAPTAEALRLTYAMALTVLFRLLFVAYAEDRDLLPYGANDDYRRRALKTTSRALHERDAPPGPGDGLWRGVSLLFDAVRDGNPDWGVPAYGG